VMRNVFKYAIPAPTDPAGNVSITIPANAEVLSVGTQGDNVYLWALVDLATTGTETLHLRVFGTGHSFEGRLGRFLGTVFMYDGRLVWHVWMEG